MDWWIDVNGGWRYSQAQIQDLVAYPIPRFCKAAQSFGSVSFCARREPEKYDDVWLWEVDTSGAKAPIHFVGIMRELKLPPPSFINYSAAGESDAVALDRNRRQNTSTTQRRIGGHRNL